MVSGRIIMDPFMFALPSTLSNLLVGFSEPPDQGSSGCRAKAKVLVHYPPPVVGRLCQVTREGEGEQGDFGPETRWGVEKG